MSYLSTKHQMRRPARKALGSDITDYLDAIAAKFGTSTLDSQTDCVNKANAATTPLDAKINSMAATWNPTGVYKPSDMSTILSQTLAMINNAVGQVNTAPMSASDSDTMLAEALDKLNRANAESVKFTTANASALKDGSAQIQSTDFKDWVIKSMQRTSFALSVASVMDCNETWLGHAIDWLDGAITGIFNFAVKVGSEALDITKQLVKIPGELSDLAGNLVKLGALAGAAYLFYEYVYKKQKRRK